MRSAAAAPSRAWMVAVVKIFRKVYISKTSCSACVSPSILETRPGDTRKPPQQPRSFFKLLSDRLRYADAPTYFIYTKRYDLGTRYCLRNPESSRLIIGHIHCAS